MQLSLVSLKFFQNLTISPIDLVSFLDWLSLNISVNNYRLSYKQRRLW